jgi:hypothetical protein
LEIGSRDCEEQRVKHEHKRMQEPSARPSKALRQDLESHFITTMEAAGKSDQQVASLCAFVDEIEERLGRLNMLAKERTETLKELKEKVGFPPTAHTPCV